MNCLRIAIISVLVDRYGIEQAEGFLHFFEGWIIFIACLGLLYLEAVLLQRMTRTPRPIHEMLNVEFAGLAGRLRRITGLQASRALIFAAVAMLLAGLALHLTPTRAASQPARDPLILYPLQMGDWDGRRQRLDGTIERVLAADDYLIADFHNAETGGAANLFIAFYRSQTEGSGIHSPEVCIPSGGWEVSRWTKAETGIRLPSGAPLSVNRAIIQKGLDRQLVYYWFAQRGRHLTSDYAAKAYTVWDSVARTRTDGALVRVITPIGASEAVSAAEARLHGFLELTLAELPTYVPE
jgi:exosortase D (VPLPA-CTERM-specific)